MTAGYFSKQSQKTAFLTPKTPIRRKKRTQTYPYRPTAHREITSRLRWASKYDGRREARGSTGRRFRYSEFAIRYSPSASPAAYVALRPLLSAFRIQNSTFAAPPARGSLFLPQVMLPRAGHAASRRDQALPATRRMGLRVRRGARPRRTSAIASEIDKPG